MPSTVPTPGAFDVASLGTSRDHDVSVIVASCRAPQLVARTLDSVRDQTLETDRFEVILVVNGPQSADVSFYEEYRRRYSPFPLRTIVSEASGACHALNLGIESARMRWVTFVDDDDWVSLRFLEGLISVADDGVMPLTLIDDVTSANVVVSDNRLNEEIRPHRGRRIAPEVCPRGLGFNASKLVPTEWARSVRYDNRLKSGQDVAFFARLYGTYDFAFAVVPPHYEATYFRLLSDTSQSRRDLSYQFAVTERLDVMEVLADQLLHSRPEKGRILHSLMRSQTNFLNRYLHLHPDDAFIVNQIVRVRDIRDFPWDVLNRGLTVRQR